MRAAIYARVGNPDQVAVRHQAEVLTGQIRGMWGERTEIDIYADNGISGLRTDRPGLQKLLRNAGTYNGVFVYNMSRLSRSVPDAVGLVRQLKNIRIPYSCIYRCPHSVSFPFSRKFHMISTLLSL